MATAIRVGDAEVIALTDGRHELDRGWHFPDVPEHAWEPYGEPGEHGGFGALNFGAFAVRADGGTVLIDTGWGPYLGPPGGMTGDAALLDELAEAGIGVADVDAVAFTHLHPDHVGWNLIRDGDGVRPRFTAARYLVPALDWEHYRARAGIHPNITQQALPLAGLGVLELFGDGHPVTPSLTSVATPGHTPGHTSFLLRSAGESCFILGDLAHHPAILQETGWVQRFDADPRQAVATRRAVLDRVERDGTLVGLGHFPHPSLGHVVRAAGRRAWRPITQVTQVTQEPQVTKGEA